MIQLIDNVFQFPSATKKNSNNMESVKVDGSITGRVFILGGRGAYNRILFLFTG